MPSAIVGSGPFPQWGPGTGRFVGTSPTCQVTLVIDCGVQNVPLLARAANAPATLSGSTGSAPRVKAGIWSRSPPVALWTPRSWAIVTGAHKPVFTSSWAKYVFTDCAVACTMLNLPPSAASAFTTFHTDVGSPSHVVVLPLGMVIFAGDLIVVPVGIFSSNAAARTKILNVDPALRPCEP